MKKEITVGQVIAILSTFVIAVATGWVTMSNKIAALDTRVQNMENEQRQARIDYTKSFDELKWKIQEGNNTITTILIKLENKQNRR